MQAPARLPLESALVREAVQEVSMAVVGERVLEESVSARLTEWELEVQVAEDRPRLALAAVIQASASPRQQIAWL